MYFFYQFLFLLMIYALENLDNYYNLKFLDMFDYSEASFSWNLRVYIGEGPSSINGKTKTFWMHFS